MKAQDIIHALRTRLPLISDKFSTNISITTLVKVSGTVTATTATAHGLATGNYVCVVGAKWKTPIATITRVGTVATVTCSADHDLTEGFPEAEFVEIIGADQANFNGSFRLLTVPNRRVFTVEVANSGATSATGTMFLLEPWRYGLNGWHQVTVTSGTTFTYTTTGVANATGYGTMQLRKAIRVSGAVTALRAESAYTELGASQLTAFVVMGEVVASKSRHSMIDAVHSAGRQTVYRQMLLNNIYIYLFVPTHADATGRASRDTVTDIAKDIFKSILGDNYPTYFTNEPATTLALVSHGQLVYKGAYYIHEFHFEAQSDITNEDIASPDVTRAFRDINIDYLDDDLATELLRQETNLDDVPL